MIFLSNSGKGENIEAGAGGYNTDMVSNIEGAGGGACQDWKEHWAGADLRAAGGLGARLGLGAALGTGKDGIFPDYLLIIC